MYQSTNFTTTEYHWYSMPLNGMEYKWIENSLKNTSTKIGEIKSTHNIITEQQPQDPLTDLEGINFAALNKENECRKAFIPRNDRFVEIDISAYHPTLASHLIHYQFDTDDIHASFAKMYKVDYKKAKELTFKQLYGGVFNQYKNLPYFKKIQNYVDKLWNQFQNEGFIECPISEYKI